MIILKTFYKLAKKNILGIIAYIVIFFMISIFTAPARQMAGRDASAISLDRISVAVFDEAKTEDSKALQDYLARFTAIRPFPDDEKALNEALHTGLLSVVLRIDKDFTKKLAEGQPAVDLATDPRYSSTSNVEVLLDKYLRFARINIGKDGHVNNEKVKEELEPQAKFIFLNRESDFDSLQVQWYKIYFHFAAYVTMASSMILISQLLRDFNSENIQARTFISGTGRAAYHGQILFGVFTVILISILIYAAGAPLIGGLPNPHIPYLAQTLNLTVFSLSSIAFTYLLMAIFKSADALVALGNVFPLGLAAVSGVMMPRSFLGSAAVTIAKAFPMYYYVEAVDYDSRLGLNLLIQLLFTAAYILLALTLRRVKRQDSVNF